MGILKSGKKYSNRDPVLKSGKIYQNTAQVQVRCNGRGDVQCGFDSSASYAWLSFESCIRNGQASRFETRCIVSENPDIEKSV